MRGFICPVTTLCLVHQSNVFSTLCPAGILVLTQIINPFRTIQFTFKDQFGLAYGGLRGAICFALVFTLPDTINRKNLFVTASIAIIIFTVFIQVRALFREPLKRIFCYFADYIHEIIDLSDPSDSSTVTVYFRASASAPSWNI